MLKGGSQSAAKALSPLCKDMGQVQRLDIYGHEKVSTL